MSAIEFYLSKGYTPIAKTKNISGADTVAVWTPVSDKRVVLTNINIGGAALDTTMSFHFADYNNPVAKIATYAIPGSVMVNLDIGAWESTAVGGAIYARKLDTVKELSVNMTGFELGGR